MSDVVKNIAEKMLENETFRNNIEQGVDEIAEDGKVDMYDIPVMMKIVLENYNSIKELRITKEQFSDVLAYICVKILSDKELIKEDQVDKIEDLISKTMKLVMFNPVFVKGCKNCFIKLFSKCKA